MDRSNLSGVFFVVIAAVLVGLVLAWWSQRPSAEERRRAVTNAAFARLHETMDGFQDADWE